MFTVKGIIAACSHVLSDFPEGIVSNGRLWRAHDLAEMTQWLSAMPTEQFRAISSELMKTVCSHRRPASGCVYFRFEVTADCGYTFYSKWNPREAECRTPTAVDGERTVANARELLGQTIYVLESATELAFWQSQWHGVALIPEQIARRAFPLAFDGREK